MSPLPIVTMVAPKSTCMTLACQSSFEISVSHRAIFSCSAARMNTIPGIPPPTSLECTRLAGVALFAGHGPGLRLAASQAGRMRID